MDLETVVLKAIELKLNELFKNIRMEAVTRDKELVITITFPKALPQDMIQKRVSEVVNGIDSGEPGQIIPKIGGITGLDSEAQEAAKELGLDVVEE